jgi:CBS domain-containing protein
VLIADKFQQIVGIVTRGDMLKALESAVRDLDASTLSSHQISSVMSKPVEFVYYPSLVADMLRLQESEEIEHFPLLHSHGPPLVSNLVGVITLSALGKKYIMCVPTILNGKEK